MITNINPRKKKIIPAMFPSKKWLNLEEASAYINVSKNHFMMLAIKYGLTIRCEIRLKYFHVDEINKMIENFGTPID